MLAFITTLAIAAAVAAVLLNGSSIPVIDISALVDASASAALRSATVAAIGHACRDVGFFYVTETGVPLSLTDSIEASARRFFLLPIEEKRKMDMSLGGKAWRGYFGVGDELTSGRADQKEGIYFGTEDATSDPRPLHGPNLWPSGPEGEALKEDVRAYMAHMKHLGTVLMDAIATHLYSLHASADSPQEAALRQSFQQPTELFRIFGYPAPQPTAPPAGAAGEHFGVGEHTDYGYLTILHQDGTGGLQVRAVSAPGLLGQLQQFLRGNWIAAPPKRGSFVINLGDALEHHSGGYLRATPHRVLFARDKEHAGRQRVSFPYFFDPDMRSEMTSVALLAGKQGVAEAQGRLQRRWDGEDVLLFRGTYGDYLKRKISKVFPKLFASTVQQPEEAAADAADAVAPVGEDFVMDFHPGKEKNPAEKAAQEKLEAEQVFEWTLRLHKEQGPLTGEELVEENALLERMKLWNEKNL